MGMLSSDLKELGYERTEQESPFDENGTLWTNSYELVCDETGIVIRKGEANRRKDVRHSDEEVFRYRNSDRIKLKGGHVSSYEWGRDGDRFSY